jgi:hypothetical protein
MPHIRLTEGLPGITSLFAFRPATARPLRELAEVLLRGASPLTSGEREMIATVASSRNRPHRRRVLHVQRYVDGLATWTPSGTAAYDGMGRRMPHEGYMRADSTSVRG